MQTLRELSDALAHGEVSSRDLVEACLARIEDSEGEGARAFVHVDPNAARAQADAIDTLRKIDARPTLLAGIPISIKDLFDIRGQRTRAGSKVLNDQAPALADCPAVARLRAAGMVLIGRTNMTEFAYSGLGINPHHGTPRNPYEPEAYRIPGGSSSGAAVSVADGMAAAALGTDTGGSCRIPAAFCGITGYKPTAQRVPIDGVVPLSTTFDSIGPLAPSVDCCALLDGVLSVSPRWGSPVAAHIRDLRLAVPRDYVLEDMDDTVADDFNRAVAELYDAGAVVSEVAIPEFLELNEINARGGIPAAEAYAWHRRLLSTGAGLYDPRVRERIMRGKEQSAADYLDVLNARRRLSRDVAARTVDYDAVMYPTVPIVAPRIQDLEEDEDYHRFNMLALRNPSVSNFFDRCAISIPMHRRGGAPTGLMLMGENMGDDRLFAVARAVELALMAA